MERHIKEILKNQTLPGISLQEVLDSFNHISLTEDEYREAIIEAKRRKEARMKEKEREERAAENRKALTSRNWSFEQTKGFMLNRAQDLFKGEFKLDENNEAVFDLLCYYFSYDPKFVSLAKGMRVNNPSLEKGVILAGNFGVGKTWMMSLFRKNNRQVFHVAAAKDIAKAYHVGGEEAIISYYNKIKNAFNDPVVLYQEYSGICIEDIGAEDIKNNYGNKMNVIGDIIETRYVNKCLGPLFHGTTNWTSKQFEDFYGGRVTSRLREHVNFIELGGPDRRK